MAGPEEEEEGKVGCELFWMVVSRLVVMRDSGRLESLGVKWVDGDRWASEFCGRRNWAWRVLNECSCL